MPARYADLALACGCVGGGALGDVVVVGYGCPHTGRSDGVLAGAGGFCSEPSLACSGPESGKTTRVVDMLEAVLDFWFGELEPAQWWQKDQALDREIAGRFASLHAQAAQCELCAWRETAPGRLAEIIVLDQFSRNIYRDTPAAFACDSLALGLAQEAVASGADGKLTAAQKAFLYMPYMHSESLTIHEQAVRLYSQPALEFNLDFELRHQQIIERFGRYPHRNAILGRESTPGELEFLQQPGSSF